MSATENKAVFLSYASQDAEAVERIAEALRAAGIEVWFDKNELVGGDAWDQKIRRQIKECAIFVPVISVNTNARAEGYFRLEWKLAVDRSHLMADDAPFLFPVVIDDTSDAAARVPDKFREVQWTRLSVKDTPETLAKRVARLLGHGPATEPERLRPAERREGAVPEKPRLVGRFARATAWSVAALIAGLVAYLVLKPRRSPEEIAKLLSQVQTITEQVSKTTGETRPASNLAISEARQLAASARAMSLDKYDSTPEDYAAAEVMVKRALELDPNDAEIWALSSHLNFSFGSRGFDHAHSRVAATRSQAERALSLDPNSLDGLYALARWQRDNDDPAIAEASFKKILTREPLHSGALAGLAWIYDQTDRVDESAALYERAAAAPGGNPALARYTEYLLFFHHARFEEADRCIRQSVAAQPSANSQAGLAMVLLTWKGEADEAAHVLASGPTAVRNEPRTIWTTALVQLCQRAPEAALKTLNRFSDDYIQDNWFAGPKDYWVGRAHALTGRMEAARLAWESGLAVLEARLKAAQQNRSLHLMRGELLAWLGRNDEALREARTVAELARSDRVAWFNSEARIYAVLGRADDALPLLEKFRAAPVGQNVGWPLTAALLRLDPLWDKIRDDSRFQALCAEPAAEKNKTGATPTVMPAVPLSAARELADKARALLQGFDATREDFALAEDFCQRALKLDSTDGEVWAAYSQVNSAFGYRGWDTSPERREQTRVMAERAIRLAPESAQAKLAQAGAWSAFGINRAETEKLLREVVQERPNDQGALKFLAVTVLNRGGLDECLALNERSAALPGGDALALYNNARYLWQRGRQAEAYTMLQRSLAQKPFSSSLVLKTIMEMTWRGDLVAAEATLKQIPQSAQLEDRANYTAGLVRFYQRRADAALEAWGAFPRDYYNDFQYDGPKGLIIGLADELDHRDAAAKIEWRAALQAVEKRLAATPNNPTPYFYKAYLLACLSEKAAAEEVLRTHEQLAGVKFTAESPLSFDLALVYTRLGRFDDFFAHPPTGNLARIRIDPRFQALRADPRFESLLAENQRRKAESKK